ncbi:hypothetical protein [Carboxylicivirga marina]|uniref:STAS/SEC14 domain-containing protein n=1 Tax=Carboxylicivirga marina TaxID=2800988 RepID=A0ABS1HMB7_9BACT|nr:hypothetical protein [Carboxylicivirga marina]MBK3518822.1 hypothetical protein [Carboxylicivirga marina]
MDKSINTLYKPRHMTSYAFINDILHVSIEGPATIYDLYDFLDEIGSLQSLPEELKVFYDLRKASLDLRLDEINVLSKKAEEKTLNCKSVKTAFCVKDPKITAYAMLFSWLPESSKIKREQFSTKEAALNWLNTD